MSEDTTSVEETTAEETVSEEQNTQEDLMSVIRDLKSELSDIKGTQSHLLNAVKPKEEPRNSLTQEQIQQFQSNPALYSQFMEAETNKQLNMIRQESQKSTWDAKAYADFPAIKTSPVFTNAVKQKIQELTASGEYSANHPMLVYRAAELASTKFNNQKVQTKQNITSAEPNTRSKVINDGNKKHQISDNDPRLAFAKQLPWFEDNPKKLEAFKAALDPYVEPEKKKTTTLQRKRA
jgi:hypothetical protein